MAKSRYWGRNAHLADRADRAVRKELGKIHPLTFIIPVAFLIIGLVLGYIGGGMLPKLSNCVDAVENGVSKVLIIDGRMAHSMLIEIFTDKGIGTAIIGDN